MLTSRKKEEQALEAGSVESWTLVDMFYKEQEGEKNLRRRRPAQMGESIGGWERVSPNRKDGRIKNDGNDHGARNQENVPHQTPAGHSRSQNGDN